MSRRVSLSDLSPTSSIGRERGGKRGSYAEGDDDGLDSSLLTTPTSSVFFGGWPSRNRLSHRFDRFERAVREDGSSVTSSRCDFDDFGADESVEDEMPATDLQKVWLADERDVWVRGYHRSNGQVISAKGKVVTDVDPENVHIFMEDDLVNHDDAVDMQNLHDAPVLDLIRRRFYKGSIFTSAGGDVLLLSVNPCRPIQNLFNGDNLKSAHEAGVGLQQYNPHVYAMADRAYRGLLSEQRPQSILFSGESGSGKTEACKFVLRYLAFENEKDKIARDGHHADIKHDLEDRLMQTNPVLEAFGNAKTHLNLNSSRFGKLIQLVYNSEGLIHGARLRTFLLEKSRVVGAAQGQRSFHIFYQLAEGASDMEREQYELMRAEEYRYLCASDCLEVDGIDDVKDFQKTKRSLERIGFDESEVKDIFRLLSGVMRCGNITFRTEKTTDDVIVAEVEHLESVARLFEVDAEKLIFALTRKSITVRSECIVSSYSIEEAEHMRDGLAKAVYAELFEYVRQRINEMLMESDLDSSGTEAATGLYIWLLDLAGFEILPETRLEQLLINYSNESLQGQYHERIASLERKAYTDEGIEWHKSTYDPRENKIRLDALESSDGIFATLNEEALLPGGNDQRFRQKVLDSKYGRPIDNVKIVDSKGCGPTEFCFHHFAGNVKYDATSMLRKNKDFLHVHIEDLILSSQSPVLSHLFNRPDKQRLNRNLLFCNRTIWTQFKKQMQELNMILNSTTPRYVRCIKPNDYLQPEVFNSKKVLHQLQCSGVLEYISVRRSGLPVRMLFSDFSTRFRILSPPESFNDNDHLAIGRKVIKRMESLLPEELEDDLAAQRAIGRTKIFLSDPAHKMMEKERINCINSGVIFSQSKLRMKAACDSFCQQRQAIVSLNVLAKTCVYNAFWRRIKTMAPRNQRAFRRAKAAKTMFYMRSAQETVGSALRASIGRSGLRTAKKSALVLAILVRMFIHRKTFIDTTTEICVRNAQTTVGSTLRAKAGRSHLLAAKESSLTLSRSMRKLICRKNTRTEMALQEQAVCVQTRMMRSFWAARRYQEMLGYIVLLSKFVKVQSALKENKTCLDAANQLQSMIRGVLVEQRMKELNNIQYDLARSFKASTARRSLSEETESCLCLSRASRVQAAIELSNTLRLDYELEKKRGRRRRLLSLFTAVVISAGGVIIRCSQRQSSTTDEEGEEED